MEVKGVTFMAERIWRDSHEFCGVFIHKEDEFGGGTTVTARRGPLVVAPRGEASVLVLEHGVRLEAAPATATRDAPSESDVLEFSSSQIPIDLPGHYGFRQRGADTRQLRKTTRQEGTAGVNRCRDRGSP